VTLDLTQLTRLPGAPDENVEVLTRAIVSRRYGALGTLRERRQQPGVEFYLRVEHPGELGDPGRVWGWSCKWFILGKDNELTSGQRNQIEESVDKAIRYVDGLTDLVLCLPQRPARKDEEWIDSLGPARGISTKLWAAENYDAQLSGHDELRSTFFGELVLTPDMLAKAHERSVAPVKARWVPSLHTANHVEHQIQRALISPDSFDRLDTHINDIATRIEMLRGALADIDDDTAQAGAEAIADDLDTFVASVRAIIDAGRHRRPTEARERISDQQPPAAAGHVTSRSPCPDPPTEEAPAPGGSRRLRPGRGDPRRRSLAAANTGRRCSPVAGRGWRRRVGQDTSGRSAHGADGTTDSRRVHPGWVASN